MPAPPGRAPVYRELRAPIYSQLELASACNQRCLHCYNTWQTGALAHIMTERQVDHCVAQFARHGLVQVVATGGEPTLAPTLLLRLANALRLAKIRLSLNSNLVCMDRDLARSLKEAGVRSILTSFVSADERTHDLVTRTPGTQPRIVRGIRCVLEQGIRLGVNMVVTQHNWMDVYPTVRFLSSLGVRNVTVTKGSPPLAATSDFLSWGLDRPKLISTLDALLRAREDFGVEIGILECYPLCFFPSQARYRVFTGHRCTAGVTTCTVGVDGQVRPCSHADMQYGNLFEEDLGTIWQRMTEWRTGVFLPDRCIHCAQFARCTGGCRMEAKFHGDLRGMDPWADPDNASTMDSVRSPRVTNSIDADARLRLDQGLYLRREEWGWVVSSGPAATFLVSVQGGEMLQRLACRSSFSIAEIMAEFGLSEDEAAPFFGRLHAMGGIRGAAPPKQPSTAVSATRSFSQRG